MIALDDRVRAAVDAIPRGRVATYGDIAHEVGTSARTVGRILHRLGHDLPWWRVVDADGRPFPGALARARARLRDEETPLRADGSDLAVDLARARWRRPGITGHRPSGRATHREPEGIG